MAKSSRSLFHLETSNQIDIYILIEEKEKEKEGKFSSCSGEFPRD